jgi:hypothetical protein
MLTNADRELVLRLVRRPVSLAVVGRRGAGLTVEASIIVGAEVGIILAEEDEERRLLYVGLTRAKRCRVQDRRLISPLLRGGPVQTQNGQAYIASRWR